MTRNSSFICHFYVLIFLLHLRIFLGLHCFTENLSRRITFFSFTISKSFFFAPWAHVVAVFFIEQEIWSIEKISSLGAVLATGAATGIFIVGHLEYVPFCIIALGQATRKDFPFWCRGKIDHSVKSVEVFLLTSVSYERQRYYTWTCLYPALCLYISPTHRSVSFGDNILYLCSVIHCFL